MSKKNKSGKNIQEVVEQEEVVPASDAPAVEKAKMLFTEDKFYNDLSNPIFEAGKVYELEGADWIQRWIKRGGAIVDKNTNEPMPMDGDKGEKVVETISEEVKEETGNK